MAKRATSLKSSTEKSTGEDTQAISTGRVSRKASVKRNVQAAKDEIEVTEIETSKINKAEDIKPVIKMVKPVISIKLNKKTASNRKTTPNDLSKTVESDNVIVPVDAGYTQETLRLLSLVYDPESYTEGVSRLGSLSHDEYSLAVPTIFYLIWSVPVFKKQVELIDSILSETPDLFHSLLFNHTVLQFDQISTDRKDKFFYLLKKTFIKMSFSYILEIKNEEVLCFILENLTSKDIFSDWSDDLFLEFVGKCKPFLLQSIQNIKISEGIVRKSMKSVTNPINREALYRLFK